MTSRPTVSLGKFEWRMVVIQNVADLSSEVGQWPELTNNLGEAPDEHQAAMFVQRIEVVREHLARMALLVDAWHRSAKAASAAATVPVDTASSVPVKPKGKGGWPKGKPRVRQAPRPAVSPLAVVNGLTSDQEEVGH